MSRHDVEARRKERHVRKAQSRRRNNITFFVIIGGIVIAAVGLWMLSKSSIFDVKSIEVEGATVLSDDEVVELSKVGMGENLLRLPLQDVETRLLRSPWIESVEIIKDPPSRLRLVIEERVPVALVVARGGRAVLDHKGFVMAAYPAAGKTPYDKLTLIEAPDLDVPAGGERSSDKALRDAASVLVTLEPAIGKRVKTMVLGGTEELRFYMKNEIEVFFGSADEKEKKSRVLARILTDYAKRGGLPVYVDVRTPDSPVAKDLPDFPKDQ